MPLLVGGDIVGTSVGPVGELVVATKVGALDGNVDTEGETERATLGSVDSVGE